MPVALTTAAALETSAASHRHRAPGGHILHRDGWAQLLSSLRSASLAGCPHSRLAASQARRGHLACVSVRFRECSR